MQVRAASVLVALAVNTALADQNGAQTRQPQAESFSAGTTAVLVDVVVRDRRGRPVTDLTADQFEIYEDAALQTLGSFSVIERAGGVGIRVGRRVSTTSPPPEAGAKAAASLPAADGPTVAIVFDALRAEPLALAQKAALSYLPLMEESDARVGVFTSDPGLRVLQAYTDNLALARQAVHRLTAAGTTQQETEAERRQVLVERLNSLDALGVGRDSTFGPDGSNSTAAQNRP